MRNRKIIFAIIMIIFLGYNLGLGQRMTNQSVVTEIYVPKVIINAKWGTNTGEFGGQQAVGIEPIPYYFKPESLVVDSKGNIYILDLVNNRIQKFNNDGKYILSIPVKSFIGYQIKYIPQEIRMAEMPDEYDEKKEHQLLKTKGVPLIDYSGRIVISPSKHFGVNISMDSDDNLYYYCRKDLSITNEAGEWTPNPNDKGEVWKFVGDKLVRKWEVKLDREKLKKDKKIEVKDEKGRVIGNIVSDFQGGTRFEPEKDYEVEKQKLNKDTEKVIIKFRDGRKMEKEMKAPRVLKNTDILSTITPVIFKQRNEVMITTPRIFNKEIKQWEGQRFSYVYDFNGNLRSVIKGTPPLHNDGNDYKIDSDRFGLKIFKIERQPIRK